MDQPQEISVLLRQWSDGDRESLDRPLPLVYDELHKQARRYLRRERQDHTLQTTALIHEAYIKLSGQRNVEWENRNHFFAIICTCLCRNCGRLYNRVRSDAAAKRGVAKCKSRGELDDKVADAWAARGHARIHELDRSAIDDLNHAVSLALNSLTTQLWVGEYYMIWDVEKSVQVLENAARMDPLSPIPPAFIGFDYYMLRQYDKAIIYGHKSMKIDPHFATERAYIAQTYCAMGDAKSAENELNDILPEAVNGLSLSAKATVLAIQGKRREAEGVLAQMQRLAETQYVSPFEFATVYVSLNDRDQTFVYLNKAYDDGSEHLGFMRNMPLFDPIRDDPRYDELLRKIGFVQ